MENYVLYDEIGRGERSIVYKGRKKGTIEFVAIHCVDKSKRFELRNTVRLTHDLGHPNVVRFYEWYETTNHIWMVVELCTGYNLDLLISQDKWLPEATVKNFAVEIIKALFYIHSLGLVYCDLKPSKLLLDGPGIVKLSDFALARVEGESEIFETADDNDDDGRDIVLPKPSPSYMAPEVLMGSPHSKASDLWSFGCLLFELFTGKQPFAASSFEELVERILGDPCPELKLELKGETNEGSHEFQDLVNRLLVKDPPQRLSWSELLSHEFFDHRLDDLLENSHDYSIETLQENHDIVITECDENEEEINADKTDIANGAVDTIPITQEVKKGTYTFKSLPKNVAAKLEELKIEDEKDNTCKQVGRIPNAAKVQSLQSMEGKRSRHDRSTSSTLKSLSHSHGRQTVVLNQVEHSSKLDEATFPSPSDLIIHATDLLVSPIADNTKIKKFANPKFDGKALCCQPLKADEILALSDENITAHFNSIDTFYTSKPKANTSSMQRCKLHTSAYLASICRNADIANLIFESELIHALLYQVKNGFSSDFKARIAHCLSLLAASATLISEDFNMTEVFSALTEAIRDNSRNTLLKQHLVPALGEFLFYASTQEDTEGREISKWDVPGTTFVIITRCLNGSEDVYVQHFAAKTIENVASTNGRHCTKFVTNDTAQLLWNLYTHCTIDNQKVTALSALCRLTCQSVTVFQYVVEKAGFKKVVDALSSSIVHVQQSMLTMFALLLTSKPNSRRVVPDNELVVRVMRLLESHSLIIRGKAFLVIMAAVQESREALLTSCQARLVMHIEKDQRRSTPMKNEVPDNQVYLVQCLHHCIQSVVNAASAILHDVLQSLQSVEGRRHPSASHTKQLRKHLPNFPVILHVVTSHVFRSLIITEDFLSSVGQLLCHVKSLDSGETKFGTGVNGGQEFTYVVISVVECITQHPPLLLEYSRTISEHILPMLINLVHSGNGNTRALCFRMFSDVASLYLDNSNVCTSTTDSMATVQTDQLKQVIVEQLLPDYHLILQDQNPLPAYGLKLLSSLMDWCPDSLQAHLNQDMLVSLLHIINSHAHQGNVSMCEIIVGLVQSILVNKDIDMVLLYQHGLVDSIKSLFKEIPSLLAETNPDNDDITPFICLLDSLYVVLKYVSKEVRYALQERSKDSPDSEALNQSAEMLLMKTKPIADITGVVIGFLAHKDSQIHDGACKDLYLMAELFGGLYDDSMSPENVNCFTTALKRQDDVAQKQILRIIKRIVSSNSQHRQAIVNHGQLLVDILNHLKNQSKIEAIRTLATEILHKISV